MVYLLGMQLIVRSLRGKHVRCGFGGEDKLACTKHLLGAVQSIHILRLNHRESYQKIHSHMRFMEVNIMAHMIASEFTRFHCQYFQDND